MNMFRWAMPTLFLLTSLVAAADCSGFQITKGATTPNCETTFSIPGVPRGSYEWLVSGNLTILSGQGSTSISVSGTSGTVVAVRSSVLGECCATYNYSCGGEPNPCEDLDVLSTYISGDFALELNETGTFTANPSGGDGNYSYTWYRSDTNNGGSAIGFGQSYSAQYPNEGTYWVKVEVRDGCGLLAVSSKFVYVNCGFGCEQ